jgi:hypothetical protein
VTSRTGFVFEPNKPVESLAVDYESVEGTASPFPQLLNYVAPPFFARYGIRTRWRRPGHQDG